MVPRGVLYPYSYKAHVWIYSDVNSNLGKIAEVLNFNANVENVTNKYGKHHDELKPLVASRKVELEEAQEAVKVFCLTLAEMTSEEAHEIVKRAVQVSLDIGKFFGDFIQGISNLFSSRKMDRLEEVQKDHSHTIQMLEGQVTDLQEDLDVMRSNMTAGFIEYNQEFAIMNINLQYINSLKKCTATVRRLTNGIVDLNNGHLSPALVNITEADGIVTNLTETVTDQGMALTMRKGIHLYSQPISFDMKKGNLRILASADTFKPDQKMDLIEFVNLPAYDLDDKIAVKIGTEDSFIAISENDNSTEAVTLTPEEFGKCKNVAEDPEVPEYICDQVMINNNASNTCLGSLVLGQPLDKCSVELVEDPKPAYQFLSDETLVLFLPEAEEVLFQCQNETRVEIAAGIYRPLLTPDCSVSTKDFTFPARSVIPEVIVLKTLATVDLELSLLQETVDVELQIIPSRALPHHSTTSPNYLRKQHLQISRQKDHPPSSSMEFHVIWIGACAGAALVLVSMIIGFLVYRSCTVTKTNLKNKTQGIMG